MITYEEFKKIEIRAGKIISAEKIPDTDKLLRLMVDFGESKETDLPDGSKSIVPTPRQIVSGISAYFPDASVLVGKTCMFVTNLEPRKIRGFESNGMIFAVSTPGQQTENGEKIAGKFSLLEPSCEIAPGTLAG